MASNSSNPFSDDVLRAQLEKLPDHGGEIAVSANDHGGQVAVDAVVIDSKVKWAIGGYAKSTWNGLVEWAGVTKLRW